MLFVLFGIALCDFGFLRIDTTDRRSTLLEQCVFFVLFLVFLNIALYQHLEWEDERTLGGLHRRGGLPVFERGWADLIEDEVRQTGLGELNRG